MHQPSTALSGKVQSMTAREPGSLERFRGTWASSGRRETNLHRSSTIPAVPRPAP